MYVIYVYSNVCDINEGEVMLSHDHIVVLIFV